MTSVPSVRFYPLVRLGGGQSCLPPPPAHRRSDPPWGSLGKNPVDGCRSLGARVPTLLESRMGTSSLLFVPMVSWRLAVIHSNAVHHPEAQFLAHRRVNETNMTFKGRRPEAGIHFGEAGRQQCGQSDRSFLRGGSPLPAHCRPSWTAQRMAARSP